MNPLNHYNQINYQMQAHHDNQYQQIFKAVRGLGDYMDAAKQVDSEHQLEFILACLFMIGIKMEQ